MGKNSISNSTVVLPVEYADTIIRGVLGKSKALELGRRLSDMRGKTYKLNVLSNTLTPVANGAFVNSLSGKGNANGGTLVKVDNQVVPTESTILGSGVLIGYESHEYTYSITWNENDEDQSAGLDKSFSGYISAVLTGISE